MDDDDAADYVENLPELCKQMLLQSHAEGWTTTRSEFRRSSDPFASHIDVAKHLAASGLADYRQLRVGDFLSIKLNERGDALKKYIQRTK